MHRSAVWPLFHSSFYYSLAEYKIFDKKYFRHFSSINSINYMTIILFYSPAPLYSQYPSQYRSNKAPPSEQSTTYIGCSKWASRSPTTSQVPFLMAPQKPIGALNSRLLRKGKKGIALGQRQSPDCAYPDPCSMSQGLTVVYSIE